MALIAPTVVQRLLPLVQAVRDGTPQAITLQAVLICIGFTNPAINALAANGINTTQDLIGLIEKDVEQILKIFKKGPPPMDVP